MYHALCRESLEPPGLEEQLAGRPDGAENCGASASAGNALVLGLK